VAVGLGVGLGEGSGGSSAVALAVGVGDATTAVRVAVAAGREVAPAERISSVGVGGSVGCPVEVASGRGGLVHAASRQATARTIPNIRVPRMMSPRLAAQTSWIRSDLL